MKKTDYKGKSVSDLTKALYEKREALRTWRFGLAGSESKNTNEGGALKRDIARIMTELNAEK